MLNDSQEHGNKMRSPNWEEEEKMSDLRDMLAKVGAGDYVTAFGRDTRGHEVTRVGTLLDVPKDMKATQNGVRVPAVRVCVGEKGTDPTTRQTWTTLIPGHGSIHLTEPPAAGEWIHSEIRNIPAVRSARLDVKARLIFGGKGGKRSTEPTDSGTLAEITYADSARYEVRSVDSGEVIFKGSLQSQVWWAHAPEENEGQADDREDQGGDEHQAVTEVDYGRPVRHVETGEVVGYWTPEKFTPIEEVQR
ncbi:hypothetical protein ACFWAN_32440 [Streptomyces mirabilis]|uniref:hypothetical protein n=1 Tax=Streptomyces mirabilis TaxID=68239 RepID=UPI00365FB57C